MKKAEPAVLNSIVVFIVSPVERGCQELPECDKIYKEWRKEKNAAESTCFGTDKLL